jgi:hypothetical protein
MEAPNNNTSSEGREQIPPDAPKPPVMIDLNKYRTIGDP